MKIILLGYMASGKSTIGKELSEIVGIPFYDLDGIISEKENASINFIFETKGEIYFRKVEHQLLQEFHQQKDSYILALGGGTPCYANNHLLLQDETVHSFYLRGSIATLVARLQKEKALRPLVANIPNEELTEFVAKHLFDRNYYYQQAKHTIAIDAKSIEEIVAEITSKLT
ncbi:shikimate kinase [Flavobacterium tibetense]|uniref:Shikimate kinase n=1 Tax=Flavobacterium tibetense TaxID=2233533 RepID=A0A365NZI4_9FLAO|nr:shikimate kinase [Flavobacterium tibetense]RBA27612.1 shikimate kinase [Flavobacterium tibetense]